MRRGPKGTKRESARESHVKSEHLGLRFRDIVSRGMVQGSTLSDICSPSNLNAFLGNMTGYSDIPLIVTDLAILKGVSL